MLPHLGHVSIAPTADSLRTLSRAWQVVQEIENSGSSTFRAAKLEAEKGTRFNLPERPEGCFAQIKPGPFFGSNYK